MQIGHLRERAATLSSDIACHLLLKKQVVKIIDLCSVAAVAVADRFT